MSNLVELHPEVFKPVLLQICSPIIEEECNKLYQSILDIANSCITDFYADYQPKEYERNFSLFVGAGGLEGIPVHKINKNTWEFGIRQTGNIQTNHDPSDYVYEGAMIFGYHGTSKIAISSPWEKINESIESLLR
jgi:hypothetical protein